MYFLRPNVNHADRDLNPSLFYILNWIEHTPRVHKDEYDDPYYNDYYYWVNKYTD